MLPSAVAKAYNFPAGRNLQDQCIAIIELGGGYMAADVNAYCDKHGYPRPELYNAFVDGAVEQLSGPNGADGEVCLDLCVIAGAAPGVKILTVFAPNTEQGFADAVLCALDHELKPCAISISWGAPISGWNPKGIQLLDNALSVARDRGVTVFAASGDNGAHDGTNTLVVDFPSASPFAVGCGGTRLTLNPDGTRSSEKAWSSKDGHGATGGGTTTDYLKPDYQQGHAGLPGRNVPDIAGNADPVTGYDILVDWVAAQVGGTSAVAPLYAALCAIITSRLGKPVGNWHNSLYNDDVCIDVIGGENGGYDCITGYDCCTGMGTIDGEKLLAALAKANNLPVLEPIQAQPKPTSPVIPVTL